MFLMETDDYEFVLLREIWGGDMGSVRLGQGGRKIGTLCKQLTTKGLFALRKRTR